MGGRCAEGTGKAPFCADGVGVAGEGDDGPTCAEEGGLRLEEGDVSFEILLRFVEEGVAVAAENGHGRVRVVGADFSLGRQSAGLFIVDRFQRRESGAIAAGEICKEGGRLAEAGHGAVPIPEDLFCDVGGGDGGGAGGRPGGDGVGFKVLEGGEDGLVYMGGSLGVVEAASGGAGFVTFRREVFGDFVHVLEIGGPTYSGVVVGVDDAV